MAIRLYFIFTLLVAGLHAEAQFDTSFAGKNLKICADSLTYCFKAKNWECFARYSNPAIIGSMGGKAAYIEFIAGSFSRIPDTAWKKYESGEILQIVKTDRELQAVVEFHSAVHYGGFRNTATFYMVAQSWDGGLFWTFFDSQGSAIASRKIKPDLSPLLIIPERKEQMEPDL